jgi:peptidoglycan hydrolase-like protein with peptidoglycan-binding domain
MRRGVVLTTLLAAVAACSGGGAATTTTSTTTTTAAATTTTTSTTVIEATTTTLPTGPPVAEEGDHGEAVEAVQFLINCTGHGDLEVDGAFGPATKAAVQTAQQSLGRTTTGAVDDDTFADLSRGCAQTREITAGADPVTVVGNAAPTDPEVFTISLLSRSTLSVKLARQGMALVITVIDPGGGILQPAENGTWEPATPGEYRIEVTADTAPVTFSVEVTVVAGTAKTGDWILATNGISYQGTKLSMGADAGTVIDDIFTFLGHGVRGSYDEFDTGWYTITDPQDMGLRGIFIEGFSFLFYGPDPNNPDRPETLGRIRFEGPSDDAAGNPRPENYATTAKGITVGDTLADLEAAYGTGLRSGANSNEHYYRYSDSGGELCFYFGADTPTDTSPILEMATQCRTG